MQLEDYNRSVTDRELLAAYRAVRHFRHLLEGRQFTLYTDHKPLVSMMTKVSDPWSAMQARHLAAISEFTTDIRHVQGKANVVADALSRVEIDLMSQSLAVNFQEMSRAQKRDPETWAVRTAITGLNFRDMALGETTLLCDTSLGKPRPWVPSCFRRTVFQALHGLSHPGARATVRLVAARFVWYGLNKDVGTWARECLACQQAKIHRHVRTNPDKVPVPELQIPVCQHQPGGSPPPITRFLPPVDHRRSFLKVARGSPNSEHRYPDGDESIPDPVGFAVRCARRDHIRQGCAVRVTDVDGNCTAFGSDFTSNDSLPSPG